MIKETQITMNPKQSIYLFNKTASVLLTTLRFMFILCLLSVTSIKSIAQQNEGVIHYLVTDDGFKKRCSMEFNNKADIEKEKSRYTFYVSTSYTDLYFNSQKTKYIEKLEDATMQNSSDIFSSFNLVNRTMTMVTPIYDKHYIISDSLHVPDWNIMNDIKEIAGHICTSATTYDSVRKQKVKAWFALDIPLSIGPDRWFGLPGVILEADLNDGAVVISAEKIEYCKLTTQLDTSKKPKGQVVTQKKYNEIFGKYYARCVNLKNEYYNMAPY
jgi:GLPGLI family protein